MSNRGGPIATAASNLGYRYYRHPDRVIVEPDRFTFAAAKAKGDDVWNRAMALRPAMPAYPTGVVVPPPPAVQINLGR